MTESPMGSADRHWHRMQALRRAVLDGPAVCTRALRWAAYTGDLLPQPLGDYLEKLRHHAYKIDAADLDALRLAGHHDEEIFELTVTAALGAGMSRLAAGAAALTAATTEEERP